MTDMVVGYKLVEIPTGNIANSWGGIWGQCPAIPNPIILPNNNRVHAPSVDVEYSGFKLIPWVMSEPPATVPESITRRQCALQLLATQAITSAEALAMTKNGDVPSVIAAKFNDAVANKSMTASQRTLAEIDFAAVNYYRSNSLLSFMGLTEQQIDQFFIEASRL